MFEVSKSQNQAPINAFPIKYPHRNNIPSAWGVINNNTYKYSCFFAKFLTIISKYEERRKILTIHTFIIREKSSNGIAYTRTLFLIRTYLCFSCYKDLCLVAMLQMISYASSFLLCPHSHIVYFESWKIKQAINWTHINIMIKY